MNMYIVELFGEPIDTDSEVTLLRFNIFYKLETPKNTQKFAVIELERRGYKLFDSNRQIAVKKVEDRHVANFDIIARDLYQEAVEKGSAIMAFDHSPTSGRPSGFFPLNPIQH